MARHLAALGMASVVAAGAWASGCSQTSTTSASVPGVSAILFLKRTHTTTARDGTVTVNVAGGNTQVVDYDRYVAGGSLNLLSPPRPDGALTNLTAAWPTADFNGVDVSFDAREAVFSMKRDETDHYHLYTVDLTPGGTHAVHQKTGGASDDIDPVYLPGGRIAFVTNEPYTEMGTRADEYEHAHAVTQLATISHDGGDADRKVFAQNLSHNVAPFGRADGRLGYSRWEHLGPVNDVKLLVANPDGTNMLAIAGQHGKPANALVNVKEVSANLMVAIATSRNRTIHAGAIVLVDARNPTDPACKVAAGTPPPTGHACLDEEHAVVTNLTPDVPLDSAPSPVGRYREPSLLPDGRYLVSWADGPVNDLDERAATPPNFGVYIYDPNTRLNQLVYDDKATWDLGAVAVAPRTEPPLVGEVQRGGDVSAVARIGSVDVTQTSLTETVDGAEFTKTPLAEALKSAVAVRVIEGFSSEGAKGVTQFGLTMHEGAAVLGEAKVQADGSWLAEIPPYVPVHLQPIDAFGMAIRSQGLWIQGNPGEERRCVGCHESRTGQGVPRYGQNPTIAEQAGADKFAVAVSDRFELPWDKNDTAGKPFVQEILSAKCATSGCHTQGGVSLGADYTVSRTDPVTKKTTGYAIPFFDLSERPVTVYYDRQVKSWPVSYVSIFYPSSVSMGDVTAGGTVPPMWGVPGSARQSKLIQKVNVRSADGKTAWPTPLHPEDKGVTLTDDERRRLVLAMDLGGQFYARQNTQFVPIGSKNAVTSAPSATATKDGGP